MPKIIDSHIPIGAIQSFGANSGTNNGWLICEGQAVSRLTYAALFAIIGTTWGVGDGSNTFNLPDLRGRFLRGRDHGAGVDPNAGTRTGGDNVGSTQGDATAVKGLATSSSSVGGSFSGNTIAPSGTHGHFITAFMSGTPGISSHTFPSPATADPPYTTNTSGLYAQGGDGAHGHSVSGSIAGTADPQALTGDAETRPKNANVAFYIKF